DDVPERASDRSPEDRPAVDKGVEFPVLPAGVNLGWELGEQTFVVATSSEGRIDPPRVDADEESLETSFDEVTGELRRVLAPEWEEPPLGGGGKAFLAIGAHFLEEEIAKDDLGDRAHPLGGEGL